MVLKGIKNIVFDIGGVLVDLAYERCIESFEAIGFKGAEKFVSCYHPAEVFGALERGEVTKEEFYDEVRRISCCDFSDDEICGAYCSLLDGVPSEKLQLIRSLREQGYKIYALSNMSEVMLPTVLGYFEGDGLTALDYFDEMFISYQMGVMKPSPKIYEMILAQSGVQPEETLFIDDSEHNVSAAREFGFMVYLAGAREDLRHLFE